MQPACTMRTGRETDQPRSALKLKIRCKQIAPLTNAARLRFAQALQLTDPHTRMVVAARSVALFGLADLVLGKCKACQRLAMHPSLIRITRARSHVRSQDMRWRHVLASVTTIRVLQHA